MTTRSLALVLGVLYLGLGVLGLMPGALAGLFPVNPALALVHVAIGVWGLAAYTGRARAHVFARSAAFIFAVTLAQALIALRSYAAAALSWLAGVAACRRADQGVRRRVSG